jgi:hypothetical protein
MIVTAMNVSTGLKLLPIFEVTDVEILAFLILHLMLMMTWVMKSMCHHDTEIGMSHLWNQDKDLSEQSEEGVRQIHLSEQSEEGVRQICIGHTSVMMINITGLQWLSM